MEEKITLKKVNIIGEKFFHVFEDFLGNKVEVETTEADYRQLGQKNPTNPTRKQSKWLYSYSDYKYDTPSGRMEVDTYADNGNFYRVITNGIEECALPKTDIVDDKISKTKVDSLVAEVNEFITKSINGNSI